MIRFWCLHTTNHKRNQLPNVILTGRDTFTGVWWSPWFPGWQRGKVVKVNFQLSSQQQQIIYLCRLYSMSWLSLHSPLAVQLAQPAIQQHAAMWLWAVWTLSLFSESRDLEIFLQVLLGHNRGESLCSRWRERLINQSQLESIPLYNVAHKKPWVGRVATRCESLNLLTLLRRRECSVKALLVAPTGSDQWQAKSVSVPWHWAPREEKISNTWPLVNNRILGQEFNSHLCFKNDKKKKKRMLMSTC